MGGVSHVGLLPLSPLARVRRIIGPILKIKIGSVLVRCYGITKFFVLKTYGLYDKITKLLN